MLDEIVVLTKALVSIESTADRPKALSEILELAVANIQGCTIEHFETKGVKSALVYRSGKRPKRFKIIVNAHLDVIPGKQQQYIPQVRGRRLYGAGSMDMKAGAACLILTFLEAVRQVDYPLGLQLVTDEEVGGFHGTKYQIAEGVKADFVIAGEATKLDIVHQAKGVLWLKISCEGKAAHSAYPWKGDNAITKMSQFLNDVAKSYPTPRQEKWATTVSVSKIATSNQAYNKIPGDCEAWLDIRYIPEAAATILKAIKTLLPPDFKAEVVLQEPTQSVDKSNQYIKKLQASGKHITGEKVAVYSAHGSSDARHFAQAGCDAVEFGPLGGGIGTDNEWVDIPSLEKYHLILKDFLLSL